MRFLGWLITLPFRIVFFVLFLVLILIAALVFMSGGCMVIVFADDGPLLPETIGAWSAEGKEEVFVGEDLFLYINGGAEIYHEYGFERVTVRDYREDEHLVSVEAYEMSRGAFGIFSYLRSTEDKPLELANGGFISDYYLDFWSGNRLFVIAAREEFEGDEDAVLEIGLELAGLFPAAGEEPEAVLMLPEAGRVEGSLKYVAGPIAMRNVEPQLSRWFAGFDEAVLADFDKGRLCMMLWGDTDSASEGFVAAVAGMVESGSEEVETGDGSHLFRLEDGRYVSFLKRGDCVTAAIAKDSEGAAKFRASTENRK